MTPDKPDPVIEHRAETLLAGTMQTYSMDRRDRIPAQWSAFFQSGIDIPGAMPGAHYGVSIDARPDGTFRYGVAVETDAPPADLPEGICRMVLSAGDYAVLRRRGPVADLPAHFDWMFSTWLPGSGHRLREGAVFERYPQDDAATPDAMAYEIWVPITRRD